MNLRLRTRKLIGTFVLLIFLLLYSFLIMTIAVSGHIPENGFVQFMFYLVTGTVWAFPARFLIVWMVRPDRPAVS